MNTEKNTETTDFKVSARTAQYVRAIEKLTAAKDAILIALWDTYGDEVGNSLYSEMGFDAVEKRLQEFMYLSITETLEDTNGTTI